MFNLGNSTHETRMSTRLPQPAHNCRRSKTSTCEEAGGIRHHASRALSGGMADATPAVIDSFPDVDGCILIITLRHRSTTRVCRWAAVRIRPSEQGICVLRPLATRLLPPVR